jgi:hypothetical protein
MKLMNFSTRLANKLGVVARCGRAAAAGAAILAGGMAFVGDAQGATLLTEGFEAGDGSPWGGGPNTFGTYDTAQNFSDSPQSGIPGAGAFYGGLPTSQGANPGSGPLVSAPINLTLGDTIIEFDGWLAGWTGDLDYTIFEAEFFDGVGGGGISLGTVLLADGSLITVADGVTESVDSGGLIVPGDVGANLDNWKHYVTSNDIPGGALSATLIYRGAGGNGNDAYAESINITTTNPIPEPGTIALVAAGGLMLIGFGSRRRKRS